jgi:L-ribulose-5-phosphate 3-epimerase
MIISPTGGATVQHSDPPRRETPMQLAISSYSFHRLGAGPEGPERPSLVHMIETCARLGVAGIELIGLQIDRTEPADLHVLKQTAARHGVQIVAVAAHHNFVTPDPARRREQIDVLGRWIDVAHELGAPIVRAFGGRWATIRDFAAFMAAGGEEPPLEGYQPDDAFRWSVEAFRIACYYAGRRGVTLALENHWGLTGTADGVLRILQDTASPWLQVALDTGNFNFRPDPYAELARIAPYAILVHAKTYIGGGLYYTPDLDYRRIIRLLREAGFDGYLSIEFEGRAHPDQGIPESVAALRQAIETA